MKKILVSMFLLVFGLCLTRCDNNKNKKPTVSMLYSDWYNCVKLPSMENPFAEVYDGCYTIKIDENNNVSFKSINQEQLKGTLEYEEKEYTIDIKITFENNEIANGSLSISNDSPYLHFFYKGVNHCFSKTKVVSKEEFEQYRNDFNKFLREAFIKNNYPTIEEVEQDTLYREYTNFVHIDPCCNGPKHYTSVGKVVIKSIPEKDEFTATYSDGTIENINIYDVENIVLVKLDGTFEKLENIQNGQCFLTDSLSIFYFECEHLWDEGVADPSSSLSTPPIIYTCMLCGTTKKEPSELLEHEHNYIDGKCSCGAEEDKKYYMLSFDTDGGSIIETVLLYSGDTIIAPANPIKEGYTFKGWSPNLTDVMPESNVEVKAIWEPITFTVTFNANGGTLVAGDENQNVLSFDDIDYPTYEYYGYIIDNYNIAESDVDGIYYIDVIWKRNPELYKLDIILDNELYYSNFYQAEEIIDVELPSKEHYILITDTDIPIAMPTNDVTINIRFEIEKVYLYVWYDSNEIGVQELEYDYGDFVYESDLDVSFDLTKTGYNFNGWNREFPFKIEETMDIYSVWEPVTFHLIFDGNGADTLEPEELYIKYDEYVTLPIPEREGFKFEGWYYYTERIQNGEWRRLNSDNQLTVTAKWSYNKEYYEFGKYPQTHVSDSNLIEELNKLTEVNENGYYVYNNEEYCKINATPIVENELYYSDGTIVTKKAEWFKVEPIKWIVKGTNTYTLYPMKLLDVAVYDSYGNAYSKSQIRHYLNNDFLTTAFSKEEIELLLPVDQLITEVKVEGTSITTTVIGISDKVMLYSAMTNAENKELTDYAIARGASLTKVTNNSTNISKYYGSWWIIEQSQVSQFVYKQTYFSSYEKDYKYAEGTRLGICFNIRIILQL